MLVHSTSALSVHDSCSSAVSFFTFTVSHKRRIMSSAAREKEEYYVDKGFIESKLDEGIL